MDQLRQRQVVRDWAAAAPWAMTAREPDLLGSAFDRAWPPEEALWFDDFVRAIDEASRRSADR
jgi:hypothetical protein